MQKRMLIVEDEAVIVQHLWPVRRRCRIRLRKGLILTALLLAFFLPGRGQDISFNISPQEAGALLKSLPNCLKGASQIETLLQLADYNIRKDDEIRNKASLDTADSFIKQAKQLNADLRSVRYTGPILLSEAALARVRGDNQSGLMLVGRAIPLLQNAHDEYHLLLAWLERLYYYDLKVHDQEAGFNATRDRILLEIQRIHKRKQLATGLHAIEHVYQATTGGASEQIKLNFLDRSIAVFKQLHEKEDAIWARKEEADIHLGLGKLKLAERELLGLIIEQKSGGYPHICFTDDLLASAYLDDNANDSALHYAFEALNNVRDGADSAYLPAFDQRIGTIYSITRNWKESLVWDTAGLNYLIATNETGHLYFTIDGILNHFLLLGSPQDGLNFILDKRKKYVPSSSQEEKILLVNLARCYDAEGKKALAQKYYLDFIKLDETKGKSGSKAYDEMAYHYLVSYYLQNGKYDTAEKYCKKVMELLPKDSAEHYKTSFYFVENILLLTKQGEQQKSSLQQAAMLRNFTLAGILLLFTIVGLLYNRYRLKQRTNKKLELQQQEIEAQNFSLQHMVTEKEWLLRELHHRVKNNLQVMMSLQDLQARNLTSEEALKAVTDSSNRLYAMSLIHQKLYKEDGSGQIDMRQYIGELVRHLAEAFSPARPIKVETDLRADIELDVSQAIPIGLILNEAVTNTFKYAFPGNAEADGLRSPHLLVTLTTVGDRGEIELVIQDNGRGYFPDPDKSKRRSLGFSLMEALAEDLDGELFVLNENGLAIVIRFTPTHSYQASNNEVNPPAGRSMEIQPATLIIPD